MSDGNRSDDCTEQPTNAFLKSGGRFIWKQFLLCWGRRFSPGRFRMGESVLTCCGFEYAFEEVSSWSVPCRYTYPFQKQPSRRWSVFYSCRLSRLVQMSFSAIRSPWIKRLLLRTNQVTCCFTFSKASCTSNYPQLTTIIHKFVYSVKRKHFLLQQYCRGIRLPIKRVFHCHHQFRCFVYRWAPPLKRGLWMLSSLLQYSQHSCWPLAMPCKRYRILRDCFLQYRQRRRKKRKRRTVISLACLDLWIGGHILRRLRDALGYWEAKTKAVLIQW